MPSILKGLTVTPILIGVTTPFILLSLYAPLKSELRGGKDKPNVAIPLV